MTTRRANATGAVAEGVDITTPNGSSPARRAINARSTRDRVEFRRFRGRRVIFSDQREELNAVFRNAELPTDSDVSITIDGRRLDSTDAVIEFRALLDADGRELSFLRTSAIPGGRRRPERPRRAAGCEQLGSSSLVRSD
jgi:hypothetical protein